MKIKEVLDSKKVSISFEIFPPKKQSSFDSVMNAALNLCDLNPDFISVTYGAGGSTKGKTTDIAKDLQSKGNTVSLAHLTCVGSSKADIKKVAEELKANNIQNILALRGDIPKPDANGNMPENFDQNWKEIG